MKTHKIYQVPQIAMVDMNTAMLNTLSTIKVDDDTVIEDEEEVKTRYSQPDLWEDETDCEDEEM